MNKFNGKKVIITDKNLKSYNKIGIVKVNSLDKLYSPGGYGYSNWTVAVIFGENDTRRIRLDKMQIII